LSAIAISAGRVPRSVLPSVQFRRRILAAGASLATLAACLVYLKVDPLALFRDFHYVTNLVGEMMPPNLKLLWVKPDLWTSMLQTISMAFLGTLVGAGIAIVLAFVAASNTSPNRWVRLAVRTLLAGERCTPNIVVLLVLLIAVGIGPFAAMLSLCIGSIGMFGKLFADAIEHVDPGPSDAISAAGATRLQVIRYGILPQVAPSIVANTFYAFDVNLRAAVALGVFGGGGIGFELNVARSVLRYKDMFACLILIMVLINLMERTADYFRKRLFSLEGALK
jgi:phosphonate transport system permease protein